MIRRIVCICGRRCLVAKTAFSIAVFEERPTEGGRWWPLKDHSRMKFIGRGKGPQGKGFIVHDCPNEGEPDERTA